jgi:excisionase family DNA binding protein
VSRAREPQAEAAPDAGADAVPTYLTVRQAAAYLHLNEKKIYALIQEGAIPATRATGKWLFPKSLLDAWLFESAHGGALADRLVVAGSDDPLLAHAVSLLAAEVGREALVAYCPGGTRFGLAQLAARRASAASIHWGPAAEAPRMHPALTAEYAGHETWVIVQLAHREQGVMLRPGLTVVETSADLANPGLRWIRRQAGAGSQHFFERVARLAPAAPVAEAATERQAAFLLRQGAADCAPGARSAAGEFGLGFVTLGQEAFDLVVPRAIYFRALFQQLLRTLAGAPSRELAQRLGGYDLGPLGSLRAPA